MWVVIQMARGKTLADKAERLLAGEGILVRLRAVYKNAADDQNYFEVLVLKSEAMEARELLLEEGL